MKIKNWKSFNESNTQPQIYYTIKKWFDDWTDTYTVTINISTKDILEESTDQGINVADNNNSDGKFERIINDMFWSDEFDTDAIDEEFSGNFGTYTFSIEKDDNTSILNVIKHMESLGWITFMDYNYQKKFLVKLTP